MSSRRRRKVSVESRSTPPIRLKLALNRNAVASMRTTGAGTGFSVSIVDILTMRIGWPQLTSRQGCSTQKYTLTRLRCGSKKPCWRGSTPVWKGATAPSSPRLFRAGLQVQEGRRPIANRRAKRLSQPAETGKTTGRSVIEAVFTFDHISRNRCGWLYCCGGDP